MATNYTTLSLADIVAELSEIAGEAQAVFGQLDGHQLNWRPDVSRWSVAQCFDHLLHTNRAMFQSIEAATDGLHRPTLWQRLPVLPRLFGSILIESQMPEVKRKSTAPRLAEPSSSAIDSAIIDRFVAYQHEAAARVRSLEGRDLVRIIMVSPFVSYVTYSVLDGCRLIVTHERRHFEQARRVTREPGFPPTRQS